MKCCKVLEIKLNNLKRNNMKQNEEMHYLDAMDRDGWFTNETVTS